MDKPKIKLPRDYERIVLPDGREHKTWASKVVVPVHTKSTYWFGIDDCILPRVANQSYDKQTYIDTGVVDNLGRRVFERDPMELIAERLLQ